MPVHERIYRRLDSPPRARRGIPALAIRAHLAKYTLKGIFGRIIFFGSLVPPLVLVAVLYFMSQEPRILQATLAQLAGTGFSGLDTVAPETWRHLGANLVFWMLMMIQVWFGLMVTAMAGAPQIADDLKSHAFEVYLARPIRGSDYILGKILVVLGPSLFVTIVPIVTVLAVANILIDGTFRACLPLYGLAIIAAFVTSLVNTIVILGISSLGKSSRYATVIWFALYFVTFVLQQPLVFHTENSAFDLISYRANLQSVAAWILDLQPLRNIEMDLPNLDRGPLPSAIILATLAGGALLLVVRRLRSGRLA